MELHLDEDSGVETTREVLRRHPSLRVLVVTMLEDDDSVVASIRAGARAYLLKAASPAEAERAVRAVADGDVILGRSVTGSALNRLTGADRPGGRLPFPELTDGEREVLDLVARGLDHTTISRRLVLSQNTVRDHVSNVLTKLMLPDRSSAIVRARENGMGGDPVNDGRLGPRTR